MNPIHRVHLHLLAVALLALLALFVSVGTSFAAPPDVDPHPETGIMTKQTSKAADGGPTSEQVAARAIGGGSTHARGNAQPRAPQHYDRTDRPDGIPIPQAAAPDAHGGHYFTPEDRERYRFVAGYDKGLAPGYDPTRELAGGADERGRYETKPWKSPAGEDGTVLVKVNFDGSRSIVAVMGVDPSGNVVQLPPNTTGLKKGWRWASAADIDAKTKAAAELNRLDEERRKHAEAEAAKVKPAPAAVPPPPQETAEARKAREDADPVTQALRDGQSKSTAEKADEKPGAGKQ